VRFDEGNSYFYEISAALVYMGEMSTPLPTGDVIGV
jgi:hypothetical protein